MSELKRSAGHVRLWAVRRTYQSLGVRRTYQSLGVRRTCQWSSLVLSLRFARPATVCRAQNRAQLPPNFLRWAKSGFAAQTFNWFRVPN
jgi:hypothetical protein